MSAAVVARVSARRGLSAVVRKQCVNVQRGGLRSFSVAPTLQEKRYVQSHEWIEYSDDKKTATIGISEYAAKSIGDVVFVELPATGTEVAAGDTLGSVESVKSASDLYSPVEGTVMETNEDLQEKPSLLNQDPEGSAWIAKLDTPGGVPESYNELMDSAAYKAFTEELDQAESQG